jgi:hypothetical protein
MKRSLVLVALLGGCAHGVTAPQLPVDTFFAEMNTYCGKTLNGKLVAGDDSDAAFRDAQLVADLGDCSENEMRIALAVGDDRPRTWTVRRTPSGLRLKHTHLLKNGGEDAVSQYGGDTVDPGTATRQQFPADAYSKEMFAREGRQVSISNVWAFEIEPGQSLTYELSRPGRLFRIRFDLKPQK